jgi:hypothetical protein
MNTDFSFAFASYSDTQEIRGVKEAKQKSTKVRKRMDPC